MRIATIVGTRPQLIKAAALQPDLRARHDETFIDTGQHWDDAMAGVFFRDLGLVRPDLTLDGGGGTAAEQTGRIMVGLEGVLRDVAPDIVLVFGDTNSTLAAALVAARLGAPIAHVEAGLRSFDRAMPEEVNRIVTDHLARWAFAPTKAAVANLAAEGLTDGVHLVGDVMRDLAARTVELVRDEGALDQALHDVAGGPWRTGGFLFATIHRAENRSPAAIERWIALLDAVARPDRPVLLALHPGTKAVVDATGRSLGAHVVVTEPLGYKASLAAQLHAAAVLTDSGGVQREAAWLGTPCLVLRSSTEWVETLAGEDATSVLVGLDAVAATAALDRLAPAGHSIEDARARAATRTITTDGATAAIARLLA
jgi:UDP-N-acetylglucosamine 2-epimerase